MNDIEIVPESRIIGTPEWAHRLTDAIKADHEYSARDVSLFAEHAAEAKLNQIWSVIFGDGSWERYCKECLGLPFSYVDAIIVGVGRLRKQGYDGEIPSTMAQQVAEKAYPMASQGRPPNVEKGDNSHLFDGIRGSNGAEYLAARIARDRPDILAEMKQGKYRSVRQAAIEAGIINPKTRYSLPDDPLQAAHYLAKRVDREWLQCLVAALGDIYDQH